MEKIEFLCIKLGIFILLRSNHQCFKISVYDECISKLVYATQLENPSEFAKTYARSLRIKLGRQVISKRTDQNIQN